VFCGQNYKKDTVLQWAVHRVTIGTKTIKMVTVMAMTRTYSRSHNITATSGGTLELLSL